MISAAIYLISNIAVVIVLLFAEMKQNRKEESAMNNKKQVNKDNTFGKKLRELRKAMGYTQQALAEKANIDEKHLSRVENGKYFPTYATLNKLLTALNVSLEEAGLDLEQIKVNNNPLMAKALQILNSAKDDEELKCYLEALKTTQKALEVNKQ